VILRGIFTLGIDASGWIAMILACAAGRFFKEYMKDTLIIFFLKSPPAIVPDGKWAI